MKNKHKHQNVPLTPTLMMPTDHMLISLRSFLFTLERVNIRIK